jgi:ADP-heptose:LPS heptosyltransferase
LIDLNQYLLNLRYYTSFGAKSLEDRMKQLFTRDRIDRNMTDLTEPNKPNAEAKRLLAINFGGIGDEILFLPTLASIKKYFPSWHVSLLLEPRSASVAQVTNLVDEVITFDIKKRPLMASDLLDMLSLMRNGNFDVVISSGASPAVAVLLFLSGIPRRIGYNANFLAPFLLTNPAPLNKNQYAASMYHDLVKGLGINVSAGNPEICLTSDSRDKVKKLTASLSKTKKRVVIHPGTSQLAIIKGIFKTWPAKDWAKLIELLLQEKEIEVILSGGPDDQKPVESILSALKTRSITEDTNNFVSAYGKTKSLAELGALIESSDLLVCVDSAPMHVAVGLNKPVVALFAVTDPKRLLPEDKHFVALMSQEKDTSTPRNSSHRQGLSAAPVSSAPSDQDHCPPGVVHPPESVLRSVLDQLSLSSNQARSPEHCG